MSLIGGCCVLAQPSTLSSSAGRRSPNSRELVDGTRDDQQDQRPRPARRTRRRRPGSLAHGAGRYASETSRSPARARWPGARRSRPARSTLVARMSAQASIATTHDADGEARATDGPAAHLHAQARYPPDQAENTTAVPPAPWRGWPDAVAGARACLRPVELQPRDRISRCREPPRRTRRQDQRRISCSCAASGAFRAGARCGTPAWDGMAGTSAAPRSVGSGPCAGTGAGPTAAARTAARASRQARDLPGARRSCGLCGLWVWHRAFGRPGRPVRFGRLRRALRRRPGRLARLPGRLRGRLCAGFGVLVGSAVGLASFRAWASWSVGANSPGCGDGVRLAAAGAADRDRSAPAPKPDRDRR